MKILIITNSSSGLYKFRKKLIQELVKENEINVITPDSGFIDELKELGCNIDILDIDRRGKNILSEIKLIFKYRKMISKYKPEKIITYTIKPNIYIGLINNLFKIDFYPNITGLGTAFQEDNLFKKFIINIYKLAFKNVKKVFFENSYNNEVFLKEKICTKNNSIVLNGAGVDLEEYKFTDLPSFDSIRFLFMGRIMKEKGIDELFDAIKFIKNKYPNTCFDILGGLEESYKEKIDELENMNLIKYYGRVDDVKPYIKRSHCILLPSYHEGMSNTLLEGAAMGRALITSNIHGCKEAVIDGKSGFLHNIKDVKDLVDKIEKFIYLSNEEKIAFGKESRRIVEKKFDKKKVVEHTIEKIFSRG
ncbi:glycosyltransferase family 4 protein [Clostridium perfringens]|nr:glycosyltransferase family 4 protein [Clostridium perfringens]